MAEITAGDYARDDDLRDGWGVVLLSAMGGGLDGFGLFDMARVYMEGKDCGSQYDVLCRIPPMMTRIPHEYTPPSAEARTEIGKCQENRHGLRGIQVYGGHFISILPDPHLFD